MNTASWLLKAHDTIGVCIDQLFPAANGSDEIERWEAFWRARREDAERSGMIYEHHTVGKRQLYENLTDSLEACLGGSLRNRSIVEYGAGSGYAGLCAAARGARVVLVDASAEAIRYSRLIAARLNLVDNVFYVRADLMLPPTACGVFDLCFNSGVLEHYSPEVATVMLRHMAACTRPGGVVLAAVPNLLSPLLLYRMVRCRGKGTERFYTPWLLRRAFRAAGLIRVRTSCLNAFISVEAPEALRSIAVQLSLQRWAGPLSSLFYCWAMAV